MNEPTQAAVLALLRRLVEQNSVIDLRTASIEQHQMLLDNRTNDILLRVTALEARSSSRQSGVAIRVRINDWKCPICDKPLQHGDSFKGHIRKLLPDNVSSRPKCRFQPWNSHHTALLARFHGATPADQAVAFVDELYKFTRSAVVTTYTDTESFNLISSWLSAALAVDGRPFPLLPLVSSSEHSKRRKMFAAVGADASSS